MEGTGRAMFICWPSHHFVHRRLFAELNGTPVDNGGRTRDDCELHIFARCTARSKVGGVFVELSLGYACVTLEVDWGAGNPGR